MEWGVPTPIFMPPQDRTTEDFRIALLDHQIKAIEQRLISVEGITLGRLIRSWWRSLWQ